MTNAARQRIHRAKVKKELQSLRAATGKAALPITAAGVIRLKFEAYAAEKIKGVYDTAAWEFWHYLYEQAQSYRLDYSGYSRAEYQSDRETAKANRAALEGKTN
jgi:hypothetical protein